MMMDRLIGPILGDFDKASPWYKMTERLNIAVLLNCKDIYLFSDLLKETCCIASDTPRYQILFSLWEHKTALLTFKK